MEQYNQIQAAADYINTQTKLKSDIAIVLGSGLANFINYMEDVTKILFSDIPHFSMTTVTGHVGMWVIGKIKGKVVHVLTGRFHFYEGYSLNEVTFPIRVMKALGVRHLVLTNSCGAINEQFKPGELMIINDHINTVGINPLIGRNMDVFGPRFPDASNIYSKRMREIARDVAKRNNQLIREGVYAWWSGPSYETPAEIRMLRIMGADAVGMSTVPEALVASHMQMEVLGISCLTNMASGILPQPLSHQEVLDVAKTVGDMFASLLIEIVQRL
jgi:purine-nucleoside phosphorylase